MAETEYLIKHNIVPSFDSLTMSDDMTTVIKKLVVNSSGQGSNDYECIGIANHLDYEKWNNAQRKTATDPVFKVMGEFFGMSNLFTRTHDFFEQSLVYYKDRPDLMMIKNDQVVCSGEDLVFLEWTKRRVRRAETERLERVEFISD